MEQRADSVRPVARVPGARRGASPHHIVKIKGIDVRPMLARGEDPLPRLRRAVDRLQPGEALEVTAPLLPAPLIEKLGSEGFTTRVQRTGAGAWVTVFRRPLSEAQPRS